jgi:hypothetical protein
LIAAKLESQLRGYTVMVNLLERKFLLEDLPADLSVAPHVSIFSTPPFLSHLSDESTDLHVVVSILDCTYV